MPTASSTAPGDRPRGRYALPRTSRVRTAREFRRVYSRGLRAGGDHLTIVALRRRADGHRLGLSVSKAHGPAVVRNKIKRVFREAFRLERPELPGAYDLVLIPRQRPGKYLLEEIRRELRRLVQRIESGKGRKRRPPREAGR